MNLYIIIHSYGSWNSVNPFHIFMIKPNYQKFWNAHALGQPKQEQWKENEPKIKEQSSQKEEQFNSGMKKLETRSSEQEKNDEIKSNQIKKSSLYYIFISVLV